MKQKSCLHRAGDPRTFLHRWVTFEQLGLAIVMITEGAQHLIVHDRGPGQPRFGDGPGQNRATRCEASNPLWNDLHVASIFNYFIRLSQEGAATAGGPEFIVNATVSRTPPNLF